MSSNKIIQKLEEDKKKKALTPHQQYKVASDNQWWTRRIAGLIPTAAYAVSNSSLFENIQVSGTIGLTIFSTAGLIENIFSLRAGDSSQLTKASILLLGTLSTLGISYVALDMVKTILLEEPSTAFKLLDYLGNICHDVNVGLVSLNALINGLAPDVKMPITEKAVEITEDEKEEQTALKM